MAMEIKITNQQTFSLAIETIVKDKNMPYLDAVLKYCEENNVEVESVARLLMSKNSKIRQHIQREASDLNLLKEKLSSLPI